MFSQFSFCQICHNYSTLQAMSKWNVSGRGNANLDTDGYDNTVVDLETVEFRDNDRYQFVGRSGFQFLTYTRP